MDDETALALNALNVGFYRSHASEFSATRQRPWRGWSALLRWIPERPLRVLDVGCGNARFGRFLAAHRRLRRYTGVDASEPLLAIARADAPAADAVRWIARDFVASPPDRALPRSACDLVALFGVLHGVPGESRRRALLEASAARLAPGGLLVFTCWDFRSDPRVARRLDAAAGRASAPVDPRALGAGDHLLPWGDGEALRYGSELDAAERRRLLRGLGLERVAGFCEDGPDRRHNRYCVVRRPPLS